MMGDRRPTMAPAMASGHVLNPAMQTASPPDQRPVFDLAREGAQNLWAAHAMIGTIRSALFGDCGNEADPSASPQHHSLHGWVEDSCHFSGQMCDELKSIMKKLGIEK